MNKPVGTSQRVLTPLLLLWLAGVALRLTILAVPPVIPRIHDELNLSATQIGILTGLPSMLFAFAAVPGSLLIARLGIRTALIVGLALTAIAGALRGALPDVSWLFFMTMAMGAGVAIMQVTMPPSCSCMAARPNWFRHGCLYQRLAPRRDSASGVDASTGVAACRGQLAEGFRILEHASRTHRRHRDVARATINS